MAQRLEPFRDYSEHEVINLFSLAPPDSGNEDADFAALRLWQAATSGDFDNGVVVAPVSTAAALPGELPSSDAMKTSGVFRRYLGASGQPNVGFNAYSVVEMQVEPAKAGATKAPIGITLKQTLAYDENDENLLRYPLKRDELQAVLPGHAVPILTRGLVLLKASAFKAPPGVGDALILSGDKGVLEKETVDANTLAGGVVGRVVATGSSDGGTTADKFLCKLSF